MTGGMQFYRIVDLDVGFAVELELPVVWVNAARAGGLDLQRRICTIFQWELYRFWLENQSGPEPSEEYLWNGIRVDDLPQSDQPTSLFD